MAALSMIYTMLLLAGERILSRHRDVSMSKILSDGFGNLLDLGLCGTATNVNMFLPSHSSICSRANECPLRF